MDHATAVKSPEFAQFLRGYCVALLWSSTDEVDGETVNLDDYELSTSGAASCHADCLAFFLANYADLAIYAEQREFDPSQGTPWDYAGHDFALTRNRHGVGYWDRPDITENLRNRLTAAAKAMGECWPCIDDDGEVYVQ